jgi:hypothetical protein
MYLVTSCCIVVISIAESAFISTSVGVNKEFLMRISSRNSHFSGLGIPKCTFWEFHIRIPCNFQEFPRNSLREFSISSSRKSVSKSGEFPQVIP